MVELRKKAVMEKAVILYKLYNNRAKK